jgi:hypothetical protein
LARWISPNRKKRRVLLVCNHPMMTKHLAAAQRLLRHDPRLEFSFTVESPRPPVAWELAAARSLGMPLVSHLRARLQNWDLLLLADHGGAGRFAPHLPKVQLYHSLSGGKMVDGENYRFAPSRTLRRGRPLYERMFVPGEAMCARALRGNPALGATIAVIGDAGVDAMIAMNARRAILRRELGFLPDERVVLVQSTFGAHSLMEAMGEELCEVIATLPGRYRFVLSTHPKHWSGDSRGSHENLRATLRRQREKGVVVLEMDDPWERYAIASDLCVSDHTGLVCNYAMLGKPIIMLLLPPDILSEGSEELMVYNVVPHLPQAAALPDLLARVERDYPLDGLQRVARAIVSCIGQADTRMRDHFYQLLRLPPLALPPQG